MSLRASYHLVVVLMCAACSKETPTGAGGSAAAAVLDAGAPTPKEPEFFGVYLRGSDGSLTALREVPEQKRALPKPPIVKGMSLQKAAQIMGMPVKYERFFPASGDVPTTDAQSLMSNGLVVHVDRFVSARLGALEAKADHLDEVDGKHGGPGEEVVEFATKKLKDALYQVIATSTVPSGTYYVWIQSSDDQKGFTSGYLLQVK